MTSSAATAPAEPAPAADRTAPTRSPRRSALRSRSSSLIDRDVLDARLRGTAVETLKVPVDQSAQRQQELAQERGELLLEVLGERAADAVEQHEHRAQVEARRRGWRLCAVGSLPVH